MIFIGTLFFAVFIGVFGEKYSQDYDSVFLQNQYVMELLSENMKLKKKLGATKFMRTKYSQCSEDLSQIEIDGLLMDYFKEHEYITTKEMQHLCGLSNATALRRLKERVQEGKLSHPGHKRAPFYFPEPGNYGIS